MSEQLSIPPKAHPDALIDTIKLEHSPVATVCLFSGVTCMLRPDGAMAWHGGRGRFGIAAGRFGLRWEQRCLGEEHHLQGSQREYGQDRSSRQGTGEGCPVRWGASARLHHRSNRQPSQVRLRNRRESQARRQGVYGGGCRVLARAGKPRRTPGIADQISQSGCECDRTLRHQPAGEFRQTLLERLIRARLFC
jgi:hypothetical protein